MLFHSIILVFDAHVAKIRSGYIVRPNEALIIVKTSCGASCMCSVVAPNWALRTRQHLEESPPDEDDDDER